MGGNNRYKAANERGGSGYQGDANSMVAAANRLGADEVLPYGNFNARQLDQTRSVVTEWVTNGVDAKTNMEWRRQAEVIMANGAVNHATPEVAKAAQLMGMVAAAPPTQKELYRGTTVPVSAAQLETAFKPGTQFTDALRSTSTDAGVARHFAKVGGLGGTSVMIRYQQGAKAAHLGPFTTSRADYEGQHKNESEWLTSGQYEVTRFDRGGLGRPPTITVRQIAGFDPTLGRWDQAPGTGGRNAAAKSFESMTRGG